MATLSNLLDKMIEATNENTVGVGQLSEEIADQNVLYPDSFEGTDSEKLQACFDELAETGGVISINRTYTLTDNIRIKHDSGGSHQIVVVGTGKVAGIDCGDYSFVGYDTTTKYGGLVFEHLRLNGTGIGFNFTHLIRIFFNACVIRQFTHLAYADDYIQTLYINDCTIRRGLGVTVKTADNNTDAKCYDVKIRGCVSEWGAGLLHTYNAHGCSIVQNCIEGHTATPIIVEKYMYMLDISSNYFEYNGNGVNIDFSGVSSILTGNVSNNSFVENSASGKGAILLPKNLIRSLIISGNAGTTVAEVPSDATDLSGVYYFANNGNVIDENSILRRIEPSDIISVLGSCVSSVNGKTGAVVLSAEDVGATTEGYVDNVIANLNAQGIQQTFCMAQGTTLEECLAWLEENGDKTKAYIMNGNVSDEIYGYIATRTEVEVGGYTNQLEGKLQLNYRISTSGVPALKVNNGTVSCATSTTKVYFIPVKGGDVIRVNRPINPCFDKGYARIAYFETDTPTAAGVGDGTAVNMHKLTEANGITSWTVGYDASGNKYSNYDSIKYMVVGINIHDGTAVTADEVADLVLTVNEEIKEGHIETVDTYSWTSTGHKFVK